MDARVARRPGARAAVRLALVASLCVAVVPVAAAQSPQRIAVVVTTAVNMNDSEVDDLSAALGKALEQTLGVVVTAGAETRRRLPGDGLPEGCLADAACRADLGARLDADELLMLVVARVGSRVQIDATWIDVPTGKLAARPAVVLQGDAERGAVFRGAAQALLPHLQPVPTVSEIKPGASGPTSLARPGPAQRERHMTTTAWIATGVGAAALAGSLGLGYLNWNTYGQLDDGELCGSDQDCIADESDTLRRNSLIADGLAVVGLAAGVTALVLYLGSAEAAGDPRESAMDLSGDAARDRARARRLRPVVGFGAGPEHVQISVGGAF
jgi:hypothetical protein